MKPTRSQPTSGEALVDVPLLAALVVNLLLAALLLVGAPGCGGSSGGGATFAGATAAPGETTAPTTSAATPAAPATPSAPVANTAPLTSVAAPGRPAPLNLPLWLEAGVQDDGLPGGAPMTFEWTREAGPGAATFGAADRAGTAVAFDAPGDHTLRVVVSDGELDASARVDVTVEAPTAMPAYPGAGFLGRTLDDEDTARAYYDTIDPAGERATLDRFLRRNGLDGRLDARAAYFNAGDLGFGRGMTMRRTGEGLVMSVTNYANVEDTVDDRDEIATVAMEYTPGPAGGAPFTKFYVFDADGRRVTGADLDGAGFKHVPGLCIACHGGVQKPVTNGVYGDGGDVGARFLPFDLEVFTFSNRQGFRRADQEPAFKELNRAVLETNASPATRELVEGWYGGPGLPGATQDPAFVPTGWKGHEPLYRGVVARSCRTCHIRMEPPLDFAAAAGFHALGPASVVQVADTRRMPDARVTFERFWASEQPALLLAALNARPRTIELALPITATAVEARLDDDSAEVLRARPLMFELAFLRTETPTRLLAEAAAVESATRARVEALEDGDRGERDGADLLEPRLRRLQRERRDLQDLVAQEGEATVLDARDRLFTRVDRAFADLARRGRRVDALAELQDLVDVLPRAVDAMRDLRDAIRDVHVPVVEPPR